MDKRQEADHLREKIWEIRNAIRAHRDAKGDDRCWLDDFEVWKFLRHPPTISEVREEMRMKHCAAFFHLRRSKSADAFPPDAILDQTKWDEDLDGKCSYQLGDVMTALLNQIAWHYAGSCGHWLTLEHDRILYEILPEKLPADFRLPPEDEFLGRAKTGAGCPNFWDSHAACAATCNLHQWGPCR